MTAVRRRTVTFGLAAAVVMPPRLAWAESTKVTFVLTNDIYQMGETLMADGKRRGGFARLAAVVKAERAKGGHVVFAHGGDTLSPSLMSGIDQGAHIVALTNALKPDIFVPGNHEFDFGKAVFRKRMAEAKFPVFAANLTEADGRRLAGIKDRDIVSFDGIRIGLAGAAHDNTPRMSNSEDLQFLPTVATMKAQAEALRRDGVDLVVVVMHADRQQGHDLAETHAADVILTGHNHDLFIEFDGRTLMVESSYDAQYVTVIDLHIETKLQGNKRSVEWWPQFRVVDTATVTPDPEVAAMVAGFQHELDRQMNVPLATTAVALDSRNASVRGREAAIGNLIADAMRARSRADLAIMNGGGIRGGKVYEAGSAITRRDVQTELPFGNHLVTLNIKGSELRLAIENGLSRLPDAAGRFPQVSGMTIEFDPQQPAGSRVLSIAVGGTPLDPNKFYRIAVNDFMARGGDDYSTFAAVDPLLPLEDSPLLSDEVMIYLRDLGHSVQSRIEGRITAK
jgi:2',3'-cyclic-nucleotide 2'-phosphodiesterase (5'-nucleotidase family)